MEERTVGLSPVVACVIKADALMGVSSRTHIKPGEPSFLMGCRLPEKNYGALWEFPGGQLEVGESLLTAATREIKEELGLELLTASQAPLFEFSMPKFHVTFLAVTVSGATMKLSAHSKIDWISLSDMEHYALTPASAAFVIHLLQKR